MGTASLKFRQFKSAVSDALGVVMFLSSLRGCSLLMGVCRRWGFALWDAGVLGLLVFRLCIVGLMGGVGYFAGCGVASS